jgi:periplasmic divalent cation tolerance protein
MTQPLIQIVTTIDTETHARQLAESLVQHALAACVQIDGPICSVYRWQGKVETSEEWRCTIKTTAGRFDEVRRHIRSLHPYEVPEIVATAIDGSGADYAQWACEQVRAEEDKEDTVDGKP